MGNCWAQCFGLFRREANRIQRGGGSKYFRSSTAGEHYTIEFENLVESDEGESSQICPRPISDEEISHLKEHRYAAISDKQALIDEKLNTELLAEEEKLRLEEEAVFAAQREAARLTMEQKLKEGKQQQPQRTKPRSDPESNDPQHKTKVSDAEFEVYLQSVKAQSEVFRSNRLSSETNVVTPNTESSWDFTSKTDATSLDLEWEDEEGMNRMGPAWERSKTEEDILRAALRPGGKQLDSGPTSEDSNALEWENDFVSAHPEDSGDHADEDFEGFVNPVLDTPTEEAGHKASSDEQER
ncbi:AP-1 complex-associated regulatory protein-like [Sinocyclocheilus rhinocerous]|uniref:AP-1 complex-associated regulatory protein-like n=1 Tax=Sinocyclocheilus rhinocerous TaxID=307959 RepID=A0A673L9B2_9TELE|nr:PREDICTED: AP-1 complex-associated regulatory protein-like [Sinocyclocheilus rhinocerous]